MENINKKTSVRLVIPNLSNSLKDIDSKHREWTKHFEGYECGIRENGDCYVVVDVEDMACRIMFDMGWDGVDMRIEHIFNLKYNREHIPHSDDSTFEIYYDIFHSNHYYLDRDFKNILLIVQIIINDVEISDSEAKIRDILNLITNVYKFNRKKLKDMPEGYKLNRRKKITENDNGQLNLFRDQKRNK